jgi:hypothetical protein
MKRLAVLGAILVAGVELLALLLRQRQFLLAASGITVALLLLGILRMLGESSADPTVNQAESDDAGKVLRSWISGTETRVHRSESTRTDWDRHWRPVLAQRFGMVTGQLRTKDPAAFDATGRMLFGPRLWQWVDPTNVARTGGHEPGPGRAALEEILQRLEQQ